MLGPPSAGSSVLAVSVTVVRSDGAPIESCSAALPLLPKMPSIEASRLTIGEISVYLKVLQLRVISGLSQVLGTDHPCVTALRNWKLQNRDLEAQPT